MAKLLIDRKAHKRKAYTRKDGTHVKGSSVDRVRFKAKDLGKPGRTPKAKRWYETKVETGWEKGMPMMKRRRLVLRAHNGNHLSSARAMQALANVTVDRQTKALARKDALYFYAEHKKRSK